MRIAIVDDIPAERKNLHDKLRTLLNQSWTESHILEFDRGTPFLSAASVEKFDLVFLDIYMHDEIGVDIAKQLRSFDPDCILIFVTTSTDHALEGFRVRALHYLVKPYTDEELHSLMEEVLLRIPAQEKTIEVKTLTASVRLPLRDILCAEHHQHQVYIKTISGSQLVTRQTFTKFTAELDDDRFFLCNRGTIVNLDHVEDFAKGTFTLTGGIIVTISRGLVKAARAAFGERMFRKER